GGLDGTTFASLSDLWAYRPGNNTWLQLGPTGGPPAGRSGHTAIWDPGNAQMLVFGGNNGSVLNDLWAYRPASNSWVPLSLGGGGPAARDLHTAVWDASNAQMLVFGGRNSGGNWLNDLWAYRPASNTWGALSPTGGPPPVRYLHAAAWDSAD